jgi:tRNA nucleotidyltransferase (CCA-adding enzyme)
LLLGLGVAADATPFTRVVTLTTGDKIVHAVKPLQAAIVVATRRGAHAIGAAVVVLMDGCCPAPGATGKLVAHHAKGYSVDIGWEHFEHEADMGVRGIGATPAEAFAQAALALTAIITETANVAPLASIEVSCEGPDLEYLFADWLNALVYEMATRHMLFCRFEVHIDAGRLQARVWGEPVSVKKHQPAVEVKGATYTMLSVKQLAPRCWVAQCVVDV